MNLIGFYGLFILADSHKLVRKDAVITIKAVL